MNGYIIRILLRNVYRKQWYLHWFLVLNINHHYHALGTLAIQFIPITSFCLRTWNFRNKSHWRPFDIMLFETLQTIIVFQVYSTLFAVVVCSAETSAFGQAKTSSPDEPKTQSSLFATRFVPYWRSSFGSYPPRVSMVSRVASPHPAITLSASPEDASVAASIMSNRGFVAAAPLKSAPKYRTSGSSCHSYWYAARAFVSPYY